MCVGVMSFIIFVQVKESIFLVYSLDKGNIKDFFLKEFYLEIRHLPEIQKKLTAWKIEGIYCRKD